MWKLLRHYGVPEKIISSFEVKTRVRQGCLLSPFLFLLVIYWIMKSTTTGSNNGIQWTLWMQLDDLHFADDPALLSHNHSQMQDKTTLLETTSAGTGLKINRKKTELMKMNTTANAPVTVGGEPIREVESFVYLGSVVDQQGDTDTDPDILQNLPEAHLQNQMAREDPKWRSVGASGTGTSGLADTVEEVGLDWTHPQEASIQHYTPSPDLEPAGEKEERPASQQLEVRHWSRAETAGDQLIRNDKSSPEQSAMVGGRWWPMLHRERWA